MNGKWFFYSLFETASVRYTDATSFITVGVFVGCVISFADLSRLKQPEPNYYFEFQNKMTLEFKLCAGTKTKKSTMLQLTQNYPLMDMLVRSSGSCPLPTALEL